MRKIQISSLREVVDNINYIKKNDINLISIRDTQPVPEYDIIDNAGLKNLLVIQFDDLEAAIPEQYNRTEKPPEENDIKNILNWSKQKMQENNNGFIIHCTAGISRSSAVAILVNYLQDPENAIKVINPMLHWPNKKVLELGEKILENRNLKEKTLKVMEDNGQDFWNNKEKEYNEKVKNLF